MILLPVEARPYNIATAMPKQVSFLIVRILVLREILQPSHNAVIRVCDEAGNVIETHEHTDAFKRGFRDAAGESARAGLNPVTA
jgi:hypothetical protein